MAVNSYLLVPVSVGSQGLNAHLQIVPPTCKQTSPYLEQDRGNEAMVVTVLLSTAPSAEREVIGRINVLFIVYYYLHNTAPARAARYSW